MMCHFNPVIAASNLANIHRCICRSLQLRLNHQVTDTEMSSVQLLRSDFRSTHCLLDESVPAADGLLSK